MTTRAGEDASAYCSMGCGMLAVGGINDQEVVCAAAVLRTVQPNL